jgi:hypothetical protein
MRRPRYARLSGEAIHPSGSRPRKFIIIIWQVCARDVQGATSATEVTQEVPEQDDEDTFPAPSESSGEWGISTERIARTLKHMAERPSQEARPKPEWWTPAWEELTKLIGGDGAKIEPVSPGEFMPISSEDVFMMDEIGTELGKDPITEDWTRSDADQEGCERD